MIKGKKYIFKVLDGRIKTETESFNKLAMKTFGISFEDIGGQYLPYVLMDDDVVVSNVSVNQMPFKYQGETRFYIQLGTIMTQTEYRNQGLCCWLVEKVLEEWCNRCDSLYLFANDKVLEFYPKFGFVKRDEYHYEKIVQKRYGAVRRLDMGLEADREVLLRCYEYYNPYAKLTSGENAGVLMFYCGSFMSEHVYYLEEQDLAAVVEYDAEYMECCDIYGKSEINLEEVLEILAQEEEQKVVLGFTPKDTIGFRGVPHKEEDTTLFILKGKEDLFDGNHLMFPMLSHT